MSSLAVVILAAGKGTRMKSDKAKVLHEICGRPMVCYPLDVALALRAERIVVVVGHQADAVREAVETAFPRAKIDFALQREQNGTGHAVLQAKKALRGFDGDVLILSGDAPLLRAATVREFRKQHRATKADLTVLTTAVDDPTGYGRCIVNRDGRLERIVEHRDATPSERRVDEINGGIYLIGAKLLWRNLAKVGTQNDQGEMYLTDVVAPANEAGGNVRCFEAANPDEVLGVNSRVELADASAVVRSQLNDALMKNGVTMIDPETTYIDYGVRVGADTTIEPCVMLTGKTKVGRGCHLGLGTRLHDATVADGETISAHLSGPIGRND